MFSAKPACDAAHRKGDFAEATCVVLHYYDNGQLMLAMFFAGFIDCFLEQVFQKVLSMKVGISLIVCLHNQNVFIGQH